VRPWKGRGLGAREIWIWEGGGQGSGRRKSRGSTVGTKLRMASPSPCLAAESSCSIMVPNLSRARPQPLSTGPMLHSFWLLSLSRGREQLLDHGSKPLEGAPPATEYRSDVTLFLAFGGWDFRLRSRCATSPASYGTRSDNDTSLCSRNP